VFENNLTPRPGNGGRLSSKLFQNQRPLTVDGNRGLFRGDAGALTESIRTGGVRFHSGSIRGVLPQFPYADNAA